MGFWIMAGIALFVVGNVLGSKPKDGEVGIEQLRRLLQKMDLFPRLVSPPAWIGLSDSTKLMSLSVVNDDWRLPLQHYINDQGHWKKVEQTDIETDILNGRAVALPIAPFVVGLKVQANSATIYWYDKKYIKSFSMQDEMTAIRMQSDLQGVVEGLNNIARQIAL